VSLARFKPGLLRLFVTLNELKADPVLKRMLALEIQEDLLTRNARSEQTIRKLRISNAAIKRRLTDRSNDRATARALKAQYQRNLDRIADHRRLIEVLKSVGDSVAFIYGDRFDMKQLSQREPPGFLTGKKGARFERRILRKVFERDGFVAILNDLTNSLRHGDVTIYQPSNLDTVPVVVEAKSGPIGSRGKRQMSKLEEVMSFLNTDKKVVDGIVFRRVEAPRTPTNLGDAFARVARKAIEVGYSIEEVEPGVIYSAVTSEKADSSLDEVLQALPVKQNSIVGFLSDVLVGSEGHYPIPLSIGDPELLYGLYNRDLFGFICIDVNSLNERLKKYKLSARLTRNDDQPLEITAVEGNIKGLEGIWIGSHFLGRLIAEFVTLEWFADAIGHHTASIESEAATESVLQESGVDVVPEV
jgi:hypothetical protein